MCALTGSNIIICMNIYDDVEGIYEYMMMLKACVYNMPFFYTNAASGAGYPRYRMCSLGIECVLSISQ